MTIVADINAYLADGRVEHWIPQVARAEVEFLPESTQMGDVGLAILAQIGTIGVNDRGGVVVDACGLRLDHGPYHRGERDR